MHPFQDALTQLEHQLHHPQPSDPLTPNQTEIALLAGHLSFLAHHLLQHHFTPTAHELARDLAATLTAYHPEGPLLQRDIEHPYPSLRPEPNWLTPPELPHAAALLLQHASQAHLPLPATFHEGGLIWTLLQLPEHPQDPLNPPLADLKPRPTTSPAHLAREQDLLTLFDQATLPLEAHAALLLLHVNARDQQANLHVLHLLHLAALALLATTDQHREHRTPTDTTRALRTHLTALHTELGCPRVAALRPNTTIRKDTWPVIPHLTLHALRLLRAERYGSLPPRQALVEKHLWIFFEHFDAQLLLGQTPSTHPELRVRLTLSAILALAQTPRAPGMKLPFLVELACDLTHIDPLWAWQTLQDKAEPLAEATWSLMNALELLRFQPIPEWPQCEEQVCRYLRGIAGHFFSTARRLNLRLPDQTFLENAFLPLQPLRATPFSRQEESAMMQTLATLSENVMHSLMDLSEVPEPTLEPAPAAPESSPDLPEAVERTEDAVPLPIRLPHVEAARLLLQGRAITLIGGTPDPAHHAALVQDLGLAHLDWIPVDAYAHGTHASNHIRPETAVVIIAIRWIGHAHSTLRDIARDQGVPCVMHPGGLNPSSIAWQVTQQVSRQLQHA